MMASTLLTAWVERLAEECEVVSGRMSESVQFRREANDGCTCGFSCIAALDAIRRLIDDAIFGSP